MLVIAKQDATHELYLCAIAPTAICGVLEAVTFIAGE